MVKRSRGKKATERNRETSAYSCDRKTVYLKVLLQKVFEIMTKISLAFLTAMVDGTADLPARNLPQRDEFHAMPL